MDVSGRTVYLLDTNMVVYIVDGRSQAARRIVSEQIEHSVIAVSAISQGEMLYGLAKKPGAARLKAAIEVFFSTVEILPWNSDVARSYETLRATMAAAGKSLAGLDMLIAAQAVASHAILVTRDKAFSQVPDLLAVENWADDL